MSGLSVDTHYYQRKEHCLVRGVVPPNRMRAALLRLKVPECESLSRALQSKFPGAVAGLFWQQFYFDIGLPGWLPHSSQPHDELS